MDQVKIVSLEIENVKKVALVRLTPTADGLTVIGGDNGAGKTSILDAIVYALGGEKYRPENLQREGSLANARISLELSNGLHVERAGKNCSLKVTDPTGKTAGQTLLNTFVEELALNLPKFLALPDDKKAETLLKTLGIGDELDAIDREEKAAYDKRHAYGIVCDQKKKYAAEMPEYHDVPEVPVSAAELIAESGAILKRNADRAELRQRLASLHAKVDELRRQVMHYQSLFCEAETQLAEAQKLPLTPDEETTDLQKQIDSIEDTNAKIRANADKDRAQADAEAAQAEYDKMTLEVEAVREKRRKLLDNAALPLAELGIARNDAGKCVLTYKNQPWGNMSGMERIRVAVAIIRKLKPACGFVLIDAMEAFDPTQLADFAAYLEAEKLQAITTRVSRGDECSIILEDGYAVETKTTTTERGEW